MMDPGEYDSFEDMQRRKKLSIARSKQKVKNKVQALLSTIKESRMSPGEKDRVRKEVIQTVTESIGTDNATRNDTKG